MKAISKAKKVPNSLRVQKNDPIALYGNKIRMYYA